MRPMRRPEIAIMETVPALRVNALSANQVGGEIVSWLNSAITFSTFVMWILDSFFKRERRFDSTRKREKSILWVRTEFDKAML